MLEKVEITLDKKETGGSLFDKLSAKGAALCVHTLAELEKGTITPQKPVSYTHLDVYKRQALWKCR